MKWKPVCATGKGPAEARRVVAVGETGNGSRRVSATLQCPETRFTAPWGSLVQTVKLSHVGCYLVSYMIQAQSIVAVKPQHQSTVCRQGTQIKTPTTKWQKNVKSTPASPTGSQVARCVAFSFFLSRPTTIFRNRIQSRGGVENARLKPSFSLQILSTEMTSMPPGVSLVSLIKDIFNDWLLAPFWLITRKTHRQPPRFPKYSATSEFPWAISLVCRQATVPAGTDGTGSTCADFHASNFGR